MATQYSKITPTAYNNARTSVVGVLGVTTTGTIDAIQGYGQAVSSSTVAQYEKVTEAHLDNLRLDIVKAYTHQQGTAPTITDVAQGDKALASLFTAYETLASGININRDTVDSGQLASVTYTQTETYDAYTGTVPPDGRGWKNYAFYEFSITFTDADKARYFFNAGGTFDFTASRTGGTVAPAIGLNQNQAWTDLLADVTAINPKFTRTNFYQLTDAYSTGFYTKNSTAVGYTANFYRLSAKSDVADNSLGGATEITFKIEFVDAFNDSNNTNYDGVDGVFTSTIVRKMPKGAGAGGAVTVAAPSAPTLTPLIGFTENGTPIYITAAYTISANKSTINESTNKTITFTFTATNYNVPNIVTWKIKASTTTSLVDFVEGSTWTTATDLDGYKLIFASSTTSGDYDNSTASISITADTDQLTEGTETFTVTAIGAADSSGGGFDSPPITFTVTDTSKTPTPGYTISEPTSTPKLSCIPGEGLGAVNTWYITSAPYTYTPDLVIYGIYLDLSGYADVSAYRMVLWDNTVITQTTTTYYTLPTPKTLASGSNLSFTVQVGTTSGTPGTGTVRIRLRTNSGTADGTGPNISGPSYYQDSIPVSVTVTTPTINLSLSASPSSISYYHIGSSTGSQSTTLSLRNTGNARATLSSYSVSAGVTVSYDTGLPTSVILPGETLTTDITYSSNYDSSGTSTITTNYTNPNTSPGTKQLTISVTSILAQPNLVFSLDYSSVTAEVYTDTIAVTATFTNTGQAPLNISSVTATPDAYSTGTRTGASVTSVPANSSRSTTYTFKRTRIGSGATSITVVSDDPAGNKTASITITGTARIPTFKLTSGLLGVTTTSFTDNLGRLAKNSTVKVEFYNMEPNATWGCWYFWTQAQATNTSGGIGVHATYTTSDPKLLTPGSTSNSSGYGAAWDGTGGADETKYWRVGRGRFYVQLPVGKTDAGTQQWFTNSRSSSSGAGSSSGWATSTTSPEAACGANQTWIGFKVVPNITWSLSNYAPTQGDTVTLTVSGLSSEAEMFLNSTTFQDRPGAGSSGSYRTVLSTGGLPLTNSVGELTTTIYVNNAIGSYSTTSILCYGGNGISDLFSGTQQLVEVLSPNWYYAEDASGGPPYKGYAVSPYVTNGFDGFWSGGSAGVWNFYRRFAVSNGTKNYSMWIDADDQLKVYAQGILLGQGTLGSPTVTDVSISVTDGYIHWIFEYTNVASITWMSLVLYNSPYPLNRTSANTDWTTGRVGSLRDLPGPSRW